MAVPFRKTSKSVKRIRRGNKGLQEPALVKDPTTGGLRDTVYTIGKDHGIL